MLIVFILQNEIDCDSRSSTFEILHTLKFKIKYKIALEKKKTSNLYILRKNSILKHSSNKNFKSRKINLKFSQHQSILHFTVTLIRFRLK